MGTPICNWLLKNFIKLNRNRNNRHENKTNYIIGISGDYDVV